MKTIITELVAEVERLRKENEWQDISTAPRDGTRILVQDKYGRRVVVGWGEYTILRNDCEERACWCAFETEDPWYSILYDDGELTHWRPLPKGPTE